jgi:hypothetical protein
MELDMYDLLSPNYRVSLKPVFVNQVKHYLHCFHTKKIKNLDVLVIVRHTSEPIASEAFSSWVIQPSVAAPGSLRPKTTASQDLIIELKVPITSTTPVIKGYYLPHHRHDSHLDRRASFNGDVIQAWHTIKYLWTSYREKLS